MHKFKKKLNLVLITFLVIFISYLIYTKKSNVWPYHKPELLILEEGLEKKYDNGYKPIYIYIKSSASEEEVMLLKKRLEKYPDVVAVEVVPWPKKPRSEYSAALRLVPIVKRDLNRPEAFYYPQDILDFLDDGKTNASSPTNIIDNWSLQGEPNDFFD